MTEEIKPEEKPAEVPQVPQEPSVDEKILKLNTQNAQLEAAIARQEELRAKIEQGGRAIAGQREKTPEEVAKEEAAKFLKPYGY